MENLEKKLDEIYNVSPYLEYKNKTEFTGDLNPTYGEVTKQSTNAIVNEFKEYFNEDTVFYDLGCGLGKMVTHIGLQYNPKKSCGIEYSKERVKGALDIKEKYCKNNNNISFIEGDFFNNDFSDATVVYVDNLAMSFETTEKIFKNLKKGCLFICRKEPNFNKFIKITKDNFRTTYGYKTIYYLIKE